MKAALPFASWSGLKKVSPVFTLCAECQPNHPTTLAMTTRCLLGLKRFEEALAENQRAHARDPGNADACDNIGVILEALGREQEALPWFERALAIRPTLSMR